MNSAFLKLAFHNLIWMASEVFAILGSQFQHIYNYAIILLKELNTMKYELCFLKLPVHNPIWMVSEVFAILYDHFQHIYNYVSNFHTQELGN